MNPQSDLIEVKNLSFSYDKEYPTLTNCNSTIHRGDFVGIIGPNGGGKTTFLRILMGFISPSTGEISIFGKTPKQARSLIGYVPQSNTLDKEFPISVFDFVLTGCITHLTYIGSFCKNSQRKAEEILEKLDLLNLRDCHFGSLSGGQAQRVIIARALVNSPEILILDEPTANVDQKAETAILSLLESLKGKMTILLVSHDLQAIAQHTHRILCIQKTISEMDPKQVCHHYALGLYHPNTFKTSR